MDQYSSHSSSSPSVILSHCIQQMPPAANHQPRFCRSNLRRDWNDPLTGLKLSSLSSIKPLATTSDGSWLSTTISDFDDNPDIVTRRHRDIPSLRRDPSIKRTLSYSCQTVLMPRQSVSSSAEAAATSCDASAATNPPPLSSFSRSASSGLRRLSLSNHQQQQSSSSAPVSAQSDSDDDLTMSNRRKRRAKALPHISAWKNEFRCFNEANGGASSSSSSAPSHINPSSLDCYRLLLQQKGAIQRQAAAAANSVDCRQKAEEDITLALCRRSLANLMQKRKSLAKKRSSRMTLRLHERLKAQEILNSAEQTKILTEKFNVEVTPRILSCLAPMEWLNDEVINFYMNLLQERNDRHVAQQEPVPKTYFWSTFFYTKLTGEDESGNQQNYSFKNVSRWTKRKKIDLFSYDLILVPVHIRKIHWTLGAVDLKHRQIRFYDSMNGSTGTEFYVNILQYMKDEHAEKKGKSLPHENEWIFDEETHRSVPQQSNGSDCGVFVCQFCECLSDERPFDFSQDDIPNVRLKMIFQIVEGEIK